MIGKRLSVLVATPWLYPADKGGVGVSVRLIVETMGQDMDVSVLIADWMAKEGADDDVGGLHVRRMSLPLPFEGASLIRSLASFALHAPRCLLNLRRFVRERRIDLVHINYATPNFAYFALLRRLTGIPYIVTVRGSDIANLKRTSRLDQALTRLALRRASRVVAVSKYMANMVADAVPGLRPAAVIYNALPRTPPRIGAPKTALPARYFVSVGSFIPVKGWDVLLRAFAMLPPEAADTCLVLVGGGGPNEEQRDWIRELGILDRVQFVDYAENREVLAIMHGALAVVIPSRSEGFSLVGLEAGLVGKAVVATRVGGLPEVVPEGRCGLLVPSEDPAALAEALTRIAGDPELAASLGAAFQVHARERTSVQRLAESYARVYAEALADNETRADPAPYRPANAARRRARP